LIALSSTRLKSASVIFLTQSSSQGVQSNRQPPVEAQCSL
jgi:hypothetical protein